MTIFYRTKNTKSPKCEEHTRKGEPCKNFPMKGCKYCFVHSIWKFNGVVWWRNSALHLTVGVFGVLATVFVSLMGPTQENQKEILSNQNRLLARHESTNLSQEARDLIIVNQYHDALNLFLIKFRMILHCLPLANPIEPEIEVAFHPGVDALKTEIDRTKINSSVISLIFRQYDFSKSMVNYLPRDGGQVQSNAEWLITELKRLNESCTELLSKYASTGRPELIQKIEIVQNRTENLLNPFGPRDYTRLNDDDIHWLGEFFEQILSSLNLIDRIRNQGRSTGITTTTHDKPAQHTNNIRPHNNGRTKAPEVLANIRLFSTSDSKKVVALHKLTNEMYDDLVERQRNNGAFLVGLYKGRIVTTGTLTQTGPDHATIKATVHPDVAMLGFGRDMLYELEFQAHHLGYRTIIIDNTALRGVPKITETQGELAIIGNFDTAFNNKK